VCDIALPSNTLLLSRLPYLLRAALLSIVGVTSSQIRAWQNAVLTVRSELTDQNEIARMLAPRLDDGQAQLFLSNLVITVILYFDYFVPLGQ
jgi:hypothetical protein